jgi:UDP-glucose 4-epimerase
MDRINKRFTTMYKVAVVTGGAGFIGSHLVDYLLNLGLKVRVVDNFSAGKKTNLEHLLTNSNLTIYDVDVTVLDDLESIIQGADIIFNQAASKKNICLNDPSKDLLVNAYGTLNIMTLASKYNVKKVVHASTGSVYGENTGIVNESSPLNPISYYGISKLAGDRYVKIYSNLNSINSTILRYFHVYGPRQEDDPNLGGVIAIFIRQLLEGKPITLHGDGEQVRYFTHVKDVVAANIVVATKDEHGEVYNVVSDEVISLNELITYLSEISTKKNTLFITKQRPLVGDIKSFKLDNSKIKLLGLSFISFRDGLIELFSDLHNDKRSSSQ